MVAYDKVFPQYNFASNKGYGSKEHIEAIKKYGPALYTEEALSRTLFKRKVWS